jgi:hypothetical protein
MKFFIYFSLSVIGAGISFGLGYNIAVEHCKPSVNVSYRDEMPGLGGTQDKPDTCIAYVLPGTDSVRVEYISKSIN